MDRREEKVVQIAAVPQRDELVSAPVERHDRCVRRYEAALPDDPADPHTPQ